MGWQGGGFPRLPFMEDFMNLTIFYSLYDNEPVIHSTQFDVDNVDVLLSAYKIKYPCCECVTVDLLKYLKGAIRIANIMSRFKPINDVSNNNP